MKSPITTAFIAFAMTACSGQNTVPAGQRTPEYLGNKLVEALRTNNKDLYVREVLCSRGQAIALAQAFPEPERSAAEKSIKEKFDEYHRQNLEMWDRVRRHGEEAGVEWREVKGAGVRYEIREHQGVKETGGIDVDISFQGKTYVVVIDDCMQIPKKGWVCMDGIKWHGEKRTAVNE